MALRDTTAAYGGLTRLLHGLIIALVAIQFGLGLTIDLFPKGSTAQAAWVGLHESSGIATLLVAVAMLVWRLVNPRPTLAQLPSWQRVAAHATHGLLYLLILAQPLVGLALVSFAGYPLHFYGLEFGPLASAHKPLAAQLAHVHEWAAAALAVIVGVHIVGALFHGLVRRDGVLQRMWLGADE